MKVRTLAAVKAFSESTVWVTVPTWDAGVQVPVPREGFPPDLERGSRWIVYCNTDAETWRDLHFEGWEPAPEPLDEAFFQQEMTP